MLKPKNMQTDISILYEWLNLFNYFILIKLRMDCSFERNYRKFPAESELVCLPIGAYDFISLF